MTLKKFYIIIPIIVISFIVVLFIKKENNEQIVSDKVDSVDSVNEPDHHSEDGKTALELGNKESTEEVVFDEQWEEWIDTVTDDLLQRYLAKPSFKNATEAQIASIHKQLYPQIVTLAEEIIRHNPDGPPDPSAVKHSSVSTTKGSLHHKGPQTPEAIMETYDAWYNRFYPSDATVEAKYPRVEWIQELLDMGVTITTEAHYPRMLGIRYHLVRVENDHEEWASGRRGVPPQDNFEDYKRAYIERNVWESQQIDNAEAADPEVSGGFFFDDAPDVFFPGKKNLLYVQRSFEDGIPGVDMWGEVMTTKQRFDLIYRGEHPEGWEVIYLDEDYNVLAEKPPHVTREMVREWQLPPEDWVPPEGVTLPKGFEAELRVQGWKGTWTQEPTPTDPLPEELSSQERAVQAQKMIEAEREAAKAEWEDFEKALQEFERLANMSDAELEAEFQKMFVSSLPGIITEDDIIEGLKKQFSPSRYEKAENLLKQYGPEEGFRRIAKDDPELAKKLESAFGKRLAPSQKSGRFIPRDGQRPSPNAPQPTEDN